MVPVRKPLPSGLNGTKPMPSSSSVGKDLFLGSLPPQRVLALDCSHRKHGVGPADRAGGCFGEPPVLDLAGVDELLDGAGDFFDRDVGVDAVLVVEVDRVDAEPSQRAVGGLLDGVGPAASRLAVGVDETELGRNDDLSADRSQGLADELLVGERSVDLRGVEERDAELDGASDDADHLIAQVAFGDLPSEAHAAEPERGHFEPVRAECSLVHVRKR